MMTGSSSQSPGRRVFVIFWFSVLFHCFMMYFYVALRDIFHTPMARYSLFVQKVSLNNKQPTNLLSAVHRCIFPVIWATSDMHYVLCQAVPCWAALGLYLAPSNVVLIILYGNWSVVNYFYCTAAAAAATVSVVDYSTSAGDNVFGQGQVYD